jgi:hypothetical protein
MFVHCIHMIDSHDIISNNCLSIVNDSDNENEESNGDNENDENE